MERDETSAAMRLERKSATLTSIKTKTTVIDRWASLSEGDKADGLWAVRAKAVAAFVPDNARVLDVGCGTMLIRSFLPPGCTYIPLDCIPRSSDSIVVDLNTSRLPAVDADFVIGVGVLEYLHDIPKIIRQISRQVSEGLFTYHPLNESPSRDRLSVGWVNALNEAELVTIFKASGYKSIVRHNYKKGLNFYRVSHARPSGRVRTQATPT